MAPWLRVLEAYAVEALLRTPAFHRGVEKVAKQVHRIRHGLPHEEPGGTNISDASKPGFGKHFIEEMKGQLGQAERRELEEAAMKRRTDGIDARGAVSDADAQRAERVWQSMQSAKSGHTGQARKSTAQEQADADAAWRETQARLNEKPKAGFLGAYIDAIKEQIGNSKSSR